MFFGFLFASLLSTSFPHLGFSYLSQVLQQTKVLACARPFLLHLSKWRGYIVRHRMFVRRSWQTQSPQTSRHIHLSLHLQ
ncbi:hypothetical protein BDV95DRAFT_269858 [Massariosphaeria phaeospora]|uniref:Secreted protein n=1 Tax=Massariosphaeria phaeospora TaxID=100035 RepID=A0A7C8LZM4_9PLEO|nr:hypothetical protein BDV95DRAFT_269858 [Massariosphaeria phaeospora]